MKSRWWLLCFVCWMVYASAGAAEAGARSLTVRVWTTRTLRTLTAQQVNNSPSAAPLEVAWEPGGLRVSTQDLVKQLSLNGNYRLACADASPITAAGQWTIEWQREGLRVLLTLPSERYVVAALNGEAAPDEPLASLKAMAVTIRTFALTHADRHAHEGFGLCDSTHCQALRLGAARPEVEQAVRDTAGETLWFHGQRASVYYTQHCGGQSETARAVWPAERSSYLDQSHPDSYCLRRSLAVWHATLPLTQLNEILRAQGWHTPSPITQVTVAARSQTGRAQRLEVRGNGAPASLSASSFHFAVDRALGWNRIRSDWFSTRVTGLNLEIDGKGYGHGVGLCQVGAYEMAVEGRSDAEILGFYFPGLVTAITPAGKPWRTVAGAGWLLHTAVASDALLPVGNAAWKQAQALFGSHLAPLVPVVQELPNSELFRQTTHQPGWMLASTSGQLVFLQPSSLRGGMAATESLLVHEFLHVLVEQEADGHTPLWLREGLVETLADPTKPPVLDMAPGQVEAALAAPRSVAESRHAHRVAGSMTALLRDRYGMAAVRQYLRNGVPAEIVRSLEATK